MTIQGIQQYEDTGKIQALVEDFLGNLAPCPQQFRFIRELASGVGVEVLDAGRTMGKERYSARATLWRSVLSAGQPSTGSVTYLLGPAVKADGECQP